MPTKKARQKLMKHRICSVARVIACSSFLILTIIAVSSLVRAMSLTAIANENGVPASWETASLGNPNTITVPISYWDQRQDDCDDPNRQFEWVICNYWTAGAVQGIIKDHLGVDGLPIPTFTNATDSWNTNYDVFTANVTGQDPVQPTDNFYRWFHETAKSKRYDREITFQRTGKNTYTYGATNVFPLDNTDFSKDDSASKKNGHNYHFTAHLNFATKISADGSELFEFSGDDDVWVFLNGKLVLDIGGLHEKLDGWFKINADGTISTYVQNVNNTGVRSVLGEPSSDYNSYVNPLNQLIRETYQDKYETIDIGLKPGDVVNLDFFYAERSTTESNTKITISNMNWPISADSDISAEIVGQLPDNNSNLVKFSTSITNRDPEHQLELNRFAAYIFEESADGDSSNNRSGFLPLDKNTLYYTTTPSDESSWQPVDISAPANTTNGFNLAQPLRMSQNGKTGDTLYFRYYGETSDFSGNMTSLVSYYTTMNGDAGVTYDYATVEYSVPVIPDTEYTVTIKYLYEDDSEASPAFSENYKPGTDFNIESPEIPDYVADIELVSGIIQDSDLTYIVRYTPRPVDIEDPIPAQPKLTIHYVYEDGSRAADDYVETLQDGDSFDIESPAIADHIPDYDRVKGIMPSNDLEYIVRYHKQTPPPAPVQPNLPTPPSIPLIPHSNIISGDLLYLAPLGEVAFVPNTGLIGETMASVFEEGFAEIILSQAFVMVMLAIFAGSFAVYFTLRQFINFHPATASITRAQKTSAKTRKKSYTKMAKAKSTSKNTRSNTKTKSHSKKK